MVVSLLIMKKNQAGFTLAEVLVTVTIISTIGAIAFPIYTRNLTRANQNTAKASVASIQAVITAFIDETGSLPKSWEDLNSIAAIMKANSDGIAEIAKSAGLEEIILPGNTYKLNINPPSDTNTIYTITATPTNNADANYDIKSCIDASNGASDMTEGSKDAAAIQPNCS